MMGKKFLLDTNICVFFFRDKYDVKNRIINVGIENCALSEITVAELLYGAYCSKNPSYDIQLVKDFCAYFKIEKITDSLDEYALQKSRLRSEGMLIDDNDLFIGASAISGNYILVTDNVKHFKRLRGIEIENWINR